MSTEVKNEKLYCGSGVEKFDGNLIEISVCLSKIPQEHRFEYEGKWYTKLKVNKKLWKYHLNSWQHRLNVSRNNSFCLRFA